MIRSFGLVASIGLATASYAQDVTSFDGTYRQDATATCTGFGEPGGALRIEDEIFYGSGAQCEMADPVEIRDMDATLFDFICERDDAIWASRFFLSLSDDDGLIVVSDGFAFKYDRCDPNDPVGAVTTAPTIGITGDLRGEGAGAAAD